jgi:hypothetical protein
MVKELDLFESNHGCWLNALSQGNLHAGSGIAAALTFRGVVALHIVLRSPVSEASP